MNLSPHFTLSELTFSEIGKRFNWDNTPTPEIIANLTRLAETLELVRALISKAIHINSGYRNALINKAVGGSRSSQHVSGCAADFVIHGMAPREVCETIIASGIEFDQLILEHSSWIHLSVPTLPGFKPRFNKLIIDEKGTRAFT